MLADDVDLACCMLALLQQLPDMLRADELVDDVMRNME
jgi:hypothetical protein